MQSGEACFALPCWPASDHRSIRGSGLFALERPDQNQTHTERRLALVGRDWPANLSVSSRRGQEARARARQQTRSRNGAHMRARYVDLAPPIALCILCIVYFRPVCHCKLHAASSPSPLFAFRLRPIIEAIFKCTLAPPMSRSGISPFEGLVGPASRSARQRQIIRLHTQMAPNLNSPKTKGNLINKVTFHRTCQIKISVRWPLSRRHHRSVDMPAHLKGWWEPATKIV